ncbi:MAG TPA: PilZ domain-containing protein [Tepidisphaeraceae bacterium]|nr:PilZ domain-containing protein [Tepidisphaeraceae bacterium]
MELTAEQLATIVRQTDIRRWEVQNENRAAPRYWLGRRAALAHTGAGAPVGRRTSPVATVRDVSVGGIGLMVHDPMRVDDEFVVSIPAVRKRRPPLVLRCVVVRCEPDAGGAAYLIGARFLAEVSPSSAAAAPAASAAQVQAPAGVRSVPAPATPGAEDELARRIRNAILD